MANEPDTKQPGLRPPEGASGQLIPPDAKNMEIGKLLPDIGGIALEPLIKAKLPELPPDNCTAAADKPSEGDCQ